MNNKAALINKIAKALLDLDTLQSRKSDSLDYHKHSVWNIQSALEAAFEAGYRAAAPTTPGQLRRLAEAEQKLARRRL